MILIDRRQQLRNYEQRSESPDRGPARLECFSRQAMDRLRRAEADRKDCELRPYPENRGRERHGAFGGVLWKMLDLHLVLGLKEGAMARLAALVRAQASRLPTGTVFDLLVGKPR